MSNERHVFSPHRWRVWHGLCVNYLGVHATTGHLFRRVDFAHCRHLYSCPQRRWCGWCETERALGPDGRCLACLK